MRYVFGYDTTSAFIVFRHKDFEHVGIVLGPNTVIFTIANDNLKALKELFVNSSSDNPEIGQVFSDLEGLWSGFLKDKINIWDENNEITDPIIESASSEFPDELRKHRHAIVFSNLDNIVSALNSVIERKLCSGSQPLATLLQVYRDAIIFASLDFSSPLPDKYLSVLMECALHKMEGYQNTLFKVRPLFKIFRNMNLRSSKILLTLSEYYNETNKDLSSHLYKFAFIFAEGIGQFIIEFDKYKNIDEKSEIFKAALQNFIRNLKEDNDHQARDLLKLLIDVEDSELAFALYEKQPYYCTSLLRELGELRISSLQTLAEEVGVDQKRRILEEGILCIVEFWLKMSEQSSFSQYSTEEFNKEIYQFLIKNISTYLALFPAQQNNNNENNNKDVEIASEPENKDKARTYTLLYQFYAMLTKDSAKLAKFRNIFSRVDHHIERFLLQWEDDFMVALKWCMRDKLGVFMKEIKELIEETNNSDKSDLEKSRFVKNLNALYEELKELAGKIQTKGSFLLNDQISDFIIDNSEFLVKGKNVAFTTKVFNYLKECLTAIQQHQSHEAEDEDILKSIVSFN